ncbi:MAG: thymidylate synthase, partial [Saprospiraceae bacterium]
THMIAQVCALDVGEFVHSFGDVHLYLNHMEQAELQLLRVPKPLPKLILNEKIKNIDDYRYEDIQLIDYQSYGAIKAPIAV